MSMTQPEISKAVVYRYLQAQPAAREWNILSGTV